MGLSLDRNIVCCATQYFKEIYGGELENLVDFEETFDEKFPVSIKEFNFVGEIIACQIAVWALRRVSYSDGSNSTIMDTILNKKIRKYEKVFGKEFNDLNKDIDY